MVGNDDERRSHRAVRRTLAVVVGHFTLAAGLLLIGCGGDTELGDYPDLTCDLSKTNKETGDLYIDIASFWAFDELEDEAFEALTSSVQGHNHVNPQRMPSRVDTQHHIRDAFTNRDLPDMFQVNGGSDVLGWVDPSGGGSSDLCELDPLRDENKWSEKYHPAALGPLSCHGKLYGWPVGIHHLNVVLYNKPLFDQLSALAADNDISLTPPEELDSPQALVDMLAVVAKLEAKTPSGEAIVPLAIGSAPNDWPLTIVAFENVLLGLREDAYQTLWMGGLEGDDGSKRSKLERSLRDMLAVLRQLKELSNYDAAETWQAAMRQVGARQALMTITGDWGYTQIADESVRNDVVTAIFPGTQGNYVYTPDSLAIPRELGRNGFRPRFLLDTIAEDRTSLLEFANVKHAIPPRVDLSDNELSQLISPGLRESHDQFMDCAAGRNGCQLLLAVSGLGPSPATQPCVDDVDWLLALAVAGKWPSEETQSNRTCTDAIPPTPEAAEERLMELWLKMGEQRFAASCR